VRNVLIALGNSGKPEAVPVVGEALSDASPLVRATAAWALGQVSPEQARRVLSGMRRNESDPLVLEEINQVFSGSN